MIKLTGKMEIIPQILSNKLRRNNFNEKELDNIVCGFGYPLDILFILGEK
ncbi:MAG: hypothetical protein ACYDIA_23215 [Candidatus Humimicrobiaceae bacterium]